MRGAGKLFGRFGLLSCALAALITGCQLIFPYGEAEAPVQQDAARDAARDLPGDTSVQHDGNASVDRSAPPELGAPGDFGDLDSHPPDIADLLMLGDVDPALCRRDPGLWVCDADAFGGCFASCGSYGVSCSASGNCTLYVPTAQLGCSLSSGALGCDLCYEAAGDDACWRP